MDLADKSPLRSNQPVRRSHGPAVSVSLKQSSETDPLSVPYAGEASFVPGHRFSDATKGSPEAPSRAGGKTLAIIAAMEREIHPLVRSWKTRTIEHAGRRYRMFEEGNAALICGGIGAEAARRASEALIQETSPIKILSVGFAGALDNTLHIGDVLTPQVVVNFADGARSENPAGRGRLVTAKTVAGPEQKTGYARAYEASAVDMEAASVGQAAQAHGIEFVAIKAISDEANFEMPSVDRFVSAQGKFKTAQFALHIVLRPWLWKTAIVLAKNSSRASRALCDAIAEYLKREVQTDAALLSSVSTETGPGALPKCVVAHTAAPALEHTAMKGNN